MFRGVAAIDFDQEGVARLRSLDVLNAWHQKVIVINGKTIKNFHFDNRELQQNHETTRLPNGATRHTSTDDGSWLQYSIVYHDGA